MHEMSVYVHFPFCLSRCRYCDFATAVRSIDEGAYATALRRDLGRFRGELGGFRARTVYLGGGTPSLFSARTLAGLLREIDPDGGSEETTVEVNPGDTERAWFEAMVQAGVGRFSIGAQAMNDARLEWLGRRHDVRAVEETVRVAREAGARSVSLDFIYGSEGQIVDEVSRELRRLLDLGPDHVSAYELTVAEGTPLFEDVRAGRARLPQDEALVEMWTAVGEELSAGGLARYEVSSYARPGHESRHNRAYWEGEEYLGLGSGAHGFTKGPDGFTRRLGSPDLEEFLLGRGEQIESVSPEDHARELIMLGLRTTAGFPVAEVLDLAGSLKKEWRAIIDDIVKEGLAREDGGRLISSTRGMLLADELASRFF